MSGWKPDLLAEKVTISPTAGTGEQPGSCDLNSRVLLDIHPYIVASLHIDNFYNGSSKLSLCHNTDYVTLKGPITVEYHFQHHANFTDPFIIDPTVTVVIPAGETHQFYLEDTVGEHLGDWDMLVQMVSIDGQ